MYHTTTIPSSIWYPTFLTNQKKNIKKPHRITDTAFFLSEHALPLAESFLNHF
ncbi:hypothetical protein NY10_1676 [Carnobacterium antarcticum]|nr:hypothetical protein NY10_1676 [Carnobacterium sp. CP1]